MRKPSFTFVDRIVDSATRSTPFIAWNKWSVAHVALPAERELHRIPTIFGNRGNANARLADDGTALITPGEERAQDGLSTFRVTRSNLDASDQHHLAEASSNASERLLVSVDLVGETATIGVSRQPFDPATGFNLLGPELRRTTVKLAEPGKVAHALLDLPTHVFSADATISHAQLSPDGKLLAIETIHSDLSQGTTDSGLTVWSVETAKLVYQVNNHLLIGMRSWSSDSTRILLRVNDSVVAHDVRNMRALDAPGMPTLTYRAGSPTSLIFGWSGDSHIVVARRTSKKLALELCDIVSGDREPLLTIHGEDLTRVQCARLTPEQWRSALQ